MLLHNKKELNILGQTYKLEFVPDEHSADMNLGRCDSKACVIKVKSSLPYNAREVTVWHEVMHAISDLLALDIDEAQITGLATGMYQVYTANCFPKSDVLNPIEKSKRGEKK